MRVICRPNSSFFFKKILFGKGSFSRLFSATRGNTIKIQNRPGKASKPRSREFPCLKNKVKQSMESVAPSCPHSRDHQEMMIKSNQRGAAAAAAA
jgi:hypothetical protein